MSKHTPGPWVFSKSDQYGDMRFYVAQADGAPYTPDYSDVATLIAETVNSERRYIQEANARLIAAAPELLEALTNLCGLAEKRPGSLHEYKAAVDSARAAIAKATGGAA